MLTHPPTQRVHVACALQALTPTQVAQLLESLAPAHSEDAGASVPAPRVDPFFLARVGDLAMRWASAPYAPPSFGRPASGLRRSSSSLPSASPPAPASPMQVLRVAQALERLGGDVRPLLHACVGHVARLPPHQLHAWVGSSAAPLVAHLANATARVLLAPGQQDAGTPHPAAPPDLERTWALMDALTQRLAPHKEQQRQEGRSDLSLLRTPLLLALARSHVQLLATCPPREELGDAEGDVWGSRRRAHEALVQGAVRVVEGRAQAGEVRLAQVLELADALSAGQHGGSTPAHPGLPALPLLSRACLVPGTSGASGRRRPRATLQEACRLLDHLSTLPGGGGAASGVAEVLPLLVAAVAGQVQALASTPAHALLPRAAARQQADAPLAGDRAGWLRWEPEQATPGGSPADALPRAPKSTASVPLAGHAARSLLQCLVDLPRLLLACEPGLRSAGLARSCAAVLGR